VATDRVSESIQIDADLGAVFEVVGDFEAYPDWQEEFTDAEVLETGDDGWGTKARYKMSAMGITITMVLAYTYSDTEMSWRLVESDKLQRNDGAYRMADLGDGGTELTYELEIESNLPLPSFVRKKLTKKIVHDALVGVKARAEGG